MRRRDLLVGAAALGVFGVGAATVTSDRFEAVTGGQESAGTVGSTVDPVTLPRIEASGSPPGEEVVPERGRVSFVKLFATWCSTCKATMDPIGEAYDRLEDVQFVSVTNEPVGQTVDPEDVTAWWDKYDGRWPVAHDEDLELTRRVDATEVPYAVVLDADNRIVWTDRGYKEADTVVEQVRNAQ